MPPAHLHWPSAVIAALATIVVVNIAQFPALESATNDWYEAVRVKPDHDLRALVEGHFDATQRSIALYVQLRDLAPGATVILGAGVDIPGEHLLGLAAAEDVVRSDDEVALTGEQAAALAPYVVASGANSNVGHYRVAMPETARVEEVVVLPGPEVTWVVARSLVEGLDVAMP